jgi:hypothetical protein
MDATSIKGFKGIEPAWAMAEDQLTILSMALKGNKMTRQTRSNNGV